MLRNCDRAGKGRYAASQSPRPFHSLTRGWHEAGLPFHARPVILRTVSGLSILSDITLQRTIYRCVELELIGSNCSEFGARLDLPGIHFCATCQLSFRHLRVQSWVGHRRIPVPYKPTLSPTQTPPSRLFPPTRGSANFLRVAGMSSNVCRFGPVPPPYFVQRGMLRNRGNTSTC